MNAVEIEEAISDLALQPFDVAEFPFTFLAAFGNKDTTLKRLRTGNNNASDVPGGVLQRNNIHIAVSEAGTVGETLKALRASPATIKAKARFILATDGQTLEAEELVSGGLPGGDDEERGTLGMHYTSVPNILKVLNPLFLDDLRAALNEAGNNERKLLNLRKRMARIYIGRRFRNDTERLEILFELYTKMTAAAANAKPATKAAKGKKA